MLLGASSCSHQSTPQAEFDHAYKNFLQGRLSECRDEADRGYNKSVSSNPQWALKFRILEARALLEQGQFDAALRLAEDRSSNSGDAALAVSAAAIAGVSEIRMHRLVEAEQILNQASQRCTTSEVESCGDLFQALGILADERSDSSTAETWYTRSLSFARSHRNSFLESDALLNLGYESLAQGHFDEAADRSEASYHSAQSIDARVIALVAGGNMAWAFYRLGDSEKALALSLDAEKAAAELDDVYDRENLLTNIGYIYMDRHQPDVAAQNFQQALKLARGINARQDIYNALRVLARLAVQTDNVDKASDFAGQALAIARESGNHPDELYPMLVQGQIASRRGDAPKALQIFEAVEHDQVCPVFLKWEAQHSLAQLHEAQQQPNAADGEYRAALATFESARAAVQREDFQLSFLTNASRIYDDYIHFLTSRGKTDEALRWADYSRARTLSEGLGLLSKETASGTAKTNRFEPPSLNARAIAARAKGVLLFYWLGEKQSYLWAITPQKITLFPLPAAAEIDSSVQRYRQALSGPQDVLASANTDGRALYRALIAPAQALLPNGARVFIIPDGSLNSLNFETLLVSELNPHYWIEDADIVNVSSLHVLAASLARQTARPEKHARNLLLFGDSIPPSNDYPALPKAAEQMASVAAHFPATQEEVFRSAQATPAAFLASDPGQFSYIHFVAHGTASRLSPLDSAIVLSRDNPETDSFKLYARDIIQRPLRADLVTISSCYGAGERSYSGEGLVGLAWAFLRAGAHNVIAALWEVTDASTQQLMDRFYDELNQGATPDVALRAAKLSLLHASAFHNPFYWAPFQLYTGS